MNLFQKIGVFLIRIVALICLFFGVSGFIYFGMMQFLGLNNPSGFTASYGLMSGIYYFVGGIAFALFANQFGRILGYGLGDSSDSQD